MNIFISGINQQCGKTFIASGIAAIMQSLGYKTGVYKPVQTGAIDEGSYLLSPDLNYVKILDPYIITHSTYLLTSNCTPLAASELEHVKLDIDDIQNDYNILDKNTEILITEGTGGLMTPITTDLFNIHIPLKLKLPVVFVITPSNNSLNTYLNEINTAHNIGLSVLGLIVNKYNPFSENSEISTFLSVLERLSGTKILGTIKNFENNPVKTDELFSELLSSLNLQEILDLEIPKLNFD